MLFPHHFPTHRACMCPAGSCSDRPHPVFFSAQAPTPMLDRRLDELRERRKELKRDSKELRQQLKKEVRRRHKLMLAAKNLSKEDLALLLASKSA